MLVGYIMSRVWLRWDSFFRLPFGNIWVACVELAHSSLGDWKDIFITHLIIIIKSEVSTFPLLSYFFVVVCLRWLYNHILLSITYISREYWDLVSIMDAQSIEVQSLWPPGRVHLFADYTISLSPLCRLIWRHWTNKILVRYMLPSVCLRLRQFSQLSFIQYKGLCVFSLPNSPVMIVWMCTLCYYHHQIGSMNHYPLFRVRSWNNGMRCMSYYVLMGIMFVIENRKIDVDHAWIAL